MFDKAAAFRLSIPIVGRLAWFFYPFTMLMAWTSWRFRADHRKALIRNMLPLCGGDVKRAGREARVAYRNLFRYWVDVTTIPYREMEHFERDHITIVGSERLAVLERPVPVMLVSAHVGSGEMALHAIIHRGRPFVALVENVEPPEFASQLTRLRSAAGGRFYPADFKGVRACYAALKRGEVVGLLADRDIQGTGVCASLCGKHVRLPRGPWEMAQRTGAVVVPIFAARNWRDRFTLYVEEPFTVSNDEPPEMAVGRAVERWSGLLGAHLERAPGQWTVLEDYWRVHACE